MKIRLLVLMFICFLVSGCPVSPETKRFVQNKNNEDIHFVLILNHGWHTGIALPAEDLNEKIPDLGKRFKTALYYEIGWGDAGFYQAKEITTKLTLQALFSSKGAVVHVVGFKNKPEEYFPESDVIRIRLDRKNYEGMLDFIKASFSTDKSGNPISLKTGIYGDSQFYQGSGRYHAFNTCNTWTAKALASAGFDINYGFKLTSSSVMGYLKKQLQTE